MDTRLFVEYLRRGGWAWFLLFFWFLLSATWYHAEAEPMVLVMTILVPLAPMFALTSDRGQWLIQSRPVRALPVSNLELARTVWFSVVAYPAMVIAAGVLLGTWCFHSPDLEGVVLWLNAAALPSLWTLVTGLAFLRVEIPFLEARPQNVAKRILHSLFALAVFAWLLGSLVMLALKWHKSLTIAAIGTICALLMAAVSYPPSPLLLGRPLLPGVARPSSSAPPRQTPQRRDRIPWYEAVSVDPFVESILHGFRIAGYALCLFFVLPWMGKLLGLLLGIESRDIEIVNMHGIPVHPPIAALVLAIGAIGLSLLSPPELRVFATLPIRRRGLVAVCLAIPIVRLLPIGAVAMLVVYAARWHEAFPLVTIAATCVLISGTVVTLNAFLVRGNLSAKHVVVLMAGTVVSLLFLLVAQSARFS